MILSIFFKLKCLFTENSEALYYVSSRMIWRKMFCLFDSRSLLAYSNLNSRLFSACCPSCRLSTESCAPLGFVTISPGVWTRVSVSQWPSLTLDLLFCVDATIGWRYCICWHGCDWCAFTFKHLLICEAGGELGAGLWRMVPALRMLGLPPSPNGSFVVCPWLRCWYCPLYSLTLHFCLFV